MDGELDWFLNDSERRILLLRACNEKEKQEHCDALTKNIEEIRQLNSAPDSKDAEP